MTAAIDSSTPSAGRDGPEPPGDPHHGQRRLSHELGTPLHAILGNVGLMLDGSLGPLTREARACLTDIQAAGQDLLRQSRLLLLLVQALQATQPEHEETVPLGRLFGQALRQAQRTTPPDGLGSAAPVQITGDPFWLRTLACCIVDVYVANDPPGPLRLEFVPPAQIRIVWPEFQQSGVPATAVDLVRRIVELHGGRVNDAMSDAFVLCWPEERLGARGAPGAAAG